MKPPTKPLIAIATCCDPRFQARADAQRDTWVPAAREFFDVVFFKGQPTGHFLLDDSVFLPVPDDYEHLPDKVRAICAWASYAGYSKMLKSDDDSYIVPKRLLEVCPIPPHHYVGCVRHATGSHPAPYASGFGYWLDAEAMDTVARAEPTSDTAEDRWVGNTLAKAGIKPISDDYHYRWLSDKFLPYMIWRHPFSGVGHCAVYAEFSPDKMRSVHGAYCKSFEAYRRRVRKPKPRLKDWSGR